MRSLFIRLVVMMAWAATTQSGPNDAAAVATHKALTLAGAKQVMAAAMAEAKKGAGTGVIAIVDEGGNLMCVERLDGTFAAGANVSIGKARTAALFKKPTRAFEEIIKGGRTPMIALNDFTPLQGGVPILADGQVIGAIGVSGAASAQQDEEIAIAGANAISSATARVSVLVPHAKSPVVTYLDHGRVAEAFAKGEVLLDGRDGRNYMIHASRRESPGPPEVHAKDTDVIYVQNGSATLVTGGSMVDAKDTAPDEVRGSAIRDGQARQISKGDVIVVPNGTPHWFKEVQGSMTYYVVKVRA